MNNEYLIVKKDVLPRYFELVAQAKKLVEDSKVENVSAACKKVGISRSTYYKYQDAVFFYKDSSSVRKLSFNLTLSHQTGALSKVCNKLSELDISILTISQSSPIDDTANIMISCDISNMKIEVSKLQEEMEKIEEVIKFQTVSFE